MQFYIIYRGVRIHKDGDVPTEVDIENTDTSVGPVSFTHDPREMLPMYSYLTHHQVLSYIKCITAKTMLIQAGKYLSE